MSFLAHRFIKLCLGFLVWLYWQYFMGLGPQIWFSIMLYFNRYICTIHIHVLVTGNRNKQGTRCHTSHRNAGIDFWVCAYCRIRSQIKATLILVKFFSSDNIKSQSKFRAVTSLNDVSIFASTVQGTTFVVISSFALQSILLDFTLKKIQPIFMKFRRIVSFYYLRSLLILHLRFIEPLWK